MSIPWAGIVRALPNHLLGAQAGALSWELWGLGVPLQWLGAGGARHPAQSPVVSREPGDCDRGLGAAEEGREREGWGQQDRHLLLPGGPGKQGF